MRAKASRLKQLPAIYKQMRRDDPATLVFIEATEEALLRDSAKRAGRIRWAMTGPVREGLRRERELMAPIRKLADVVIDTTKFNVHELRQFIMRPFPEPGQAAR